MTILDDKRRIKLICWNNAEDAQYGEGYYIEAYGEPGIHCMIPYFKVSVGDEVIARVPAWQVSVHYWESHDRTQNT